MSWLICFFFTGDLQAYGAHATPRGLPSAWCNTT